MLFRGIILLVAVCTFAAIAHAKEYLYIHNTEGGTVTVIAIPEHEVVAQIDVGFYTDHVTPSPDGKTVYVNRIESIEGAPVKHIGVSGELIALSTETDEVQWRMDLDGMPHHMIAAKDGKRVFVPYYDTWWLAVVDVEKREVIEKIWIGHGGHGTKLSADGERLYVGSMMYDNVTVIDTETLRPFKMYPTRDGVRPFAFPKDESVLYVQESRLHGFRVIDPDTRDIVQTVYIREVQEVDGELVNVVIDRIEEVKDPVKERME